MAGYAKLFGSILFSTIWAESKDVKILWITMLALADADGTVEAAVPGLAMASRLTPDECRSALNVLESPDPDSKNPENEGRRVEKIDGGWRILNYLHYRNKMTVAYRRELNADRVRRHRENTRRVAPKPDAEPAATALPAPILGPSPHDDFNGSGNEATCPLNLHELADRFFPQMLEHMPGVAIEQLRDAARSYVTHFTVGRGMGEKRRHWMKCLRGNLHKAFEENKFRAPGLIDHTSRADGSAPESKSLKAQRAKLAEQRKLQEAAMLPGKRTA